MALTLNAAPAIALNRKGGPSAGGRSARAFQCERYSFLGRRQRWKPACLGSRPSDVLSRSQEPRYTPLHDAAGRAAACDILGVASTGEPASAHGQRPQALQIWGGPALIAYGRLRQPMRPPTRTARLGQCSEEKLTSIDTPLVVESEPGALPEGYIRDFISGLPVRATLLAGVTNHWVLSFGPPGIEVTKLKAHHWPPRDGCTHTPAVKPRG